MLLLSPLFLLQLLLLFTELLMLLLIRTETLERSLFSIVYAIANARRPDIVDTIVIAFALPHTLSLALALAPAIALALGKVCKKL